MVGWENARTLPRLLPAELERTGVLA